MTRHKAYSDQIFFKVGILDTYLGFQLPFFLYRLE